MNKYPFLAGCLLIAIACGSPKYLTYEQFGAKGDGVTDDSRVTDKDYQGPMIFGKFKRNIGEDVLYPYIAKGVIIIRGAEVANGKPLVVNHEPEMFQDYTITVER